MKEYGWSRNVRKVDPYVPGEQPSDPDIIKLNTKTSDELSVYVGNIKKFLALPGTSSDSYAVKISQIIREEE